MRAGFVVIDMRQPNPENYEQNLDLENQPPLESDPKAGYEVNAPENMGAKLEVHGKNPPKARNLPNLKK